MAERKKRLWRIIAMLGLMITPGVCTSKAEEIVLHSSNPAGVQVKDFPVSVGVPMPVGAMRDGDTVHLVDSGGRTVPCQTKVLARWWGLDRSVSTLLVTFLADTATIRLKLLKIGARISYSVRRIVLHLAEGYPHKKLFARILSRLRNPLAVPT